jgi:dienelactone hydrolase
MAVLPRSRARVAGLLIAAAALTAMIVAGRPYARGAAFVIEAAGFDGIERRAASIEFEPVAIADLPDVTWRGGPLRARRYRPAASKGGRTILLVPGVHAAGIDEPRLVGFAHDLAGIGDQVVTVELPDLAHYEITPRTADMIEDAAAWMLHRAEYRGADGRIGMMGISFGGGLTLVAAGRPSIAQGVSFAMSFGGHGDLLRTLEYLCTGVQPDGTLRPPHDYGLAIVLLNVADTAVPADQVQPLRTAILSFLEASRLDMVDKTEAAVEFERAKALEGSLPEPAHEYMKYVNARDVRKLGPILLPHLANRASNPALSPARSPAPRCPVYLLHGADDNVVPAIESTLLAREFRAKGIDVRLLETPLITHAEVDRQSTAMDVWRLVRFWTALLAE